METRLSKQQLKELRDLLTTLKHPKLKKLLKRAIKTWEEYKACSGHFGIIAEDNKVRVRFDRCCLIGAGIHGCKYQNNRLAKTDDRLIKPAWCVAGFSKFEFDVIWHAFDALPRPDSWVFDAYPSETSLIKEVFKIRDICFKKD